MKWIKWFFLSLIISVGVLFSAVSESVTLWPEVTSAAKVNGSYYAYSLTEIGKFISDSDTYVARSQYVYDLSSIDDHANITKVEVNYFSNTIDDYTFKLTKISTLKSSLPDIWSTVASSSTLHSNIDYGNSSFESTPLKTSVANALVDDQLIIGILSEKEDSLDSGTDVNFILRYIILYRSSTSL